MTDLQDGRVLPRRAADAKVPRRLSSQLHPTPPGAHADEGSWLRLGYYIHIAPQRGGDA
jgi:hypothetical protein